ncbi:MAG TPA: NAD(P)/FAD-dependent oxidoreductase [Solirubrobacterales bacterium]|jgi:2-polyprenyl-6-methoxyphenol hydroxylase-like FAD-dependent oxidoreductase
MDGDPQRFDVIVVGARCAGSPLATMLARRGLHVCLLDRASFPSDSLSTHLIQPCGVQVLERLGLLDRMLAAGAARIHRFTLVSDGVRIEADVEEEDFGAPSICLRRVRSDHLLVEAAAAAGAEVHTGAGVTELLWEGRRVAGVRTREGAFRARLVVGADGRASTVARLAGSREYRIEPGGRLFSWAYFEGVAEDEGRLRLGKVGETAYLSCPTDSGLFLAGVCPPMAARDVFVADREGGFDAGIEAWPELAMLVGGARRVGPIRVLADWNGFMREATGPGWVLLGDAGHFKDPTPAQGMSDALRQAERLAAAIAASPGDPALLDRALRRWWRWRDGDAHEMYGFATDIGSDESGLLSQELLRRLAAEKNGGEQLLRLLNHELLPAELFTLRRVGRAIGGIVRDQPRRIPAVTREIGFELRKEARRTWQHRRPRRLFRRGTRAAAT